MVCLFDNTVVGAGSRTTEETVSVGKFTSASDLIESGAEVNLPTPLVSLVVLEPTPRNEIKSNVILLKKKYYCRLAIR